MKSKKAAIKTTFYVVDGSDGARLETLKSVSSVTCFVTLANFACTLVCQLTKLRHLHEKQHFEVVFHLMPATYGRGSEPLLFTI